MALNLNKKYFIKENLLATKGDPGTTKSSSLDLEAYIETLPSKTSSLKNILRIHLFDKQSTPYSQFHNLIKADRGLGNLIKDDQAKGNIAAMYQEYAEKTGASKTGFTTKPVPGSKGTTLILNASAYDIKKFVSSVLPSIIYGSSNSGIYNASLQSMQDQLLSTVNMLRSGKQNYAEPNGSGTGGLPLRVIPSQLDMSSFGCPFLSINQQFFVDFNTGTSLDNIYLLTGLTHTISAGKYESRWKMVPLDAYGIYESVVDKFSQIKKLLETAPSSTKK
jgi:hypothetical protein